MFLLRDVSDVHQSPLEVTVGVRALRCIELSETPGYLTGEELAKQGVETTLPNLPNLQLPALDQRRYAVRVAWAAPDTVRVTVAPDGAAVLSDDGTALGIVVDPQPEPTPTTRVTQTAESVVVESPLLRVVVGRRPFTLAVENVATGERVLRTAERLRQVAGFPMAPTALVSDDSLTLHFELGFDEDITGFGEQFSRLVKNGQRLVLRVEDALGTGTGLAYKPVPVWHSSRGYTALVNTGAVVTADVGHHLPSVFGLTVADEAVDLYVIGGSTPKRRLTSYTALTGRSAVPPLWAFGYWMGRCRYHTAAEMETVARGMRRHDVPCDVLHLDPDWLVVDRLNTDFIWNTARFGDRRSFVRTLEGHQLRLSVWELPYLDPASPRYRDAEERGYLVHDRNGAVAAVARTPSPDGRPRALVDFTNAEARSWWQEMHREFLADGVAVFKTDFGEGLPDDAALADGTPSNQAHNLYPLLYQDAVSAAIARYTGRNPLVWGRSGWAGSQRYPGQWSGDAESTVAGMQATLRGGLSYALCAPGLWSHDIGGFFGPELTPGLYARWTQLGALSPLMRAHGLRPREPWEFGTRVLDIARRWVRLRYELLPYLWQVAQESSAFGWPVLRPLGLEFPDDPVAGLVDDAFLLGADLLAIPIFDDGDDLAHRRFYVPDGRWTDLLTGERYTGPTFATAEVPLERMPVLVREGAVIPRVPVDPTVRRTDDLIGRPWVLHVFGADDVERSLVGFDGNATSVRVKGTAVVAEGSQPIADEAVRHGG